MASLELKFENWKNKLLDLGKRNRLLNFKDSIRGSLRIVSPDCFELYQRIVRDEEDIVFPQYSLEEEAGDEEFENEEWDDSGIKTNKSKKDLPRVLRNLRNKAKTALEEQGINMLYLSFGFLKWTEADHSDVEYLAPLVLVPVTLTVESIVSPFILHLHEDEIVLNPTLKYKLSSEFGIELPDFDENDSLEELFKGIQDAVRIKKWEVKADVGMSLFSFLKINMYDDLKKHKDTILANPIIKAIGGVASDLPQIPGDLNDYDFDKREDPKRIFQIVDADSSQQEAILYAKSGISFVLQGPPGTGKSQTITNIIAESIANGKKVLFVSEKMAALEVVHKRLSSAGLDDFCLVLHSYKANKRSILDQLEKSLYLAQKQAHVDPEAFQKLDTLKCDREKLNDYAEQVYTKITPLGKTIYEANGIIASLCDYPDIVFSLPNVRNTSDDLFREYILRISRWIAAMGNMSVDYKNNPWNGATVETINNEFRHDASSKLSALIDKIKTVSKGFESVKKETCSDVPLSLSGMARLAAACSELDSAHEIPLTWITGEQITPLFAEISDQERIQKDCASISESIISEWQAIKTAEGLDAPDISDFADCSSVSSLQVNLNTILSKEPYRAWGGSHFEEAKKLYDGASNAAKRIKELVADLSSVYEQGIFEIDHKAIRTRMKTEYGSFMRVFKKEYKEDKKALQICRKDVVKKISDKELFSTITKLHELSIQRTWFEYNDNNLKELFGSLLVDESSDYTKANTLLTAYPAIVSILQKCSELNHNYATIGSNEQTLREHYQFLYNGIETSWEDIRKALEWSKQFRAAVVSSNPGGGFVEKVCSSKEFANDCFAKVALIGEIRASLSPEYEWFSSLFASDADFDEMSFDRLSEKAESCMNGMYYLEEYIDFRNARQNCIQIGLEDFTRAVSENNIEVNQVIPVFKKRFFRLWLDSVLPEYPAVAEFRRKTQEQTISEFACLDAAQFRIAQTRVKTKIINTMPVMDHFTTGVDEISILKKELKKQRKIMPIRKLFKAIPNLLLTLKPCLMMSPLSVSLFLEADSYNFDLVIFDEASQVCTENAIGAISRAKQVIIAGDSHQLPPTNFFQVTTTEGDYDDDEDEEDNEVFESILDEANMLPERTLQWHYRSRHESLIAFSNAKIYKNHLITFPSNISKENGIGVEYIYVPDGFYDKGGRNGNVIEAKRVAELIIQHIKTTPNRSLGVIAFGEVQQLAIETQLRALRVNNQEYERFFSEDLEEPFFIKSLENVQGDERDTIIFSIGYAKNAAGVFHMNFGPLSKAGGEKRLNVAITRAKYNVKLVGSIQPTDIDIDRVSSEGPKLLRAYINYAINGPESLQKEITESDIAEHDSPFEESVYYFLDRKGYKLATQVGCSGYRIDMAVKHPAKSGVYVLGIECDGAQYHSARTARERDRLRQDVLESMGWRIYRIWSTDWIKDPITEGERLLKAVKDAINEYDDREYASELSCLKEPDHRKSSNDANQYFALEDRKEDLHPTSKYGFANVEEYSLHSLPKGYNGLPDIKDCIELVVKHEYPIHYELLSKRLLWLFGAQKVTSAIGGQILHQITKMGNRVVRKELFVYPKSYDKIPIRLPNTRSIDFISTEELTVAMLAILRTCVGPTREGLCAETTRVYGFKRQGSNIQWAMNKAVDELISTGRVSEVDGKLRVNK